MNEFVKLMPIDRGGQDKTHIELAIAILEAIWCGWISQAKSRPNRKGGQDYPIDYPEKFKEAIIHDSENGQSYAPISH